WATKIRTPDGRPKRRLLQPLRMERSRLVDSFVGMGSEVVALRLKQVRRQTLLAITIEIRQGCAECRNGDPCLNRDRNRVAPICLVSLEQRAKERVEHEVLQLWAPVECFFDPIQEFGPNDAAASPNGCDVAEVQRPVVVFTGGGEQSEPLGIRN